MAEKEIRTFLNLPSSMAADGIDIPRTTEHDWIDKYVRMSAYCRAEVLYATAALTSKIITSGIKGDLCECGVAAGAHPAVMHYVQRQVFGNLLDRYRMIYMFDSFQGIPKPTVEDIPTEEHVGIDIRGCVGHELATPGVIESTGVTSVSVAEVQTRMARWGALPQHLYYAVGWFQHTVPETAPKIGSLALLRLDGDLYESTKVCLEHLYPKVTPGGFVIVDDWRLAGSRRAVEEYFGDDLPNVVDMPCEDPAPAFWRKPIR